MCGYCHVTPIKHVTCCHVLYIARQYECFLLCSVCMYPSLSDQLFPPAHKYCSEMAHFSSYQHLRDKNQFGRLVPFVPSYFEKDAFLYLWLLFYMDVLVVRQCRHTEFELQSVALVFYML